MIEDILELLKAAQFEIDNKTAFIKCLEQLVITSKNLHNSDISQMSSHFIENVVPYINHE